MSDNALRSDQEPDLKSPIDESVKDTMQASQLRDADADIVNLIVKRKLRGGREDEESLSDSQRAAYASDEEDGNEYRRPRIRHKKKKPKDSQHLQSPKEVPAGTIHNDDEASIHHSEISNPTSVNDPSQVEASTSATQIESSSADQQSNRINRSSTPSNTSGLSASQFAAESPAQVPRLPKPVPTAEELSRRQAQASIAKAERAAADKAAELKLIKLKQHSAELVQVKAELEKFKEENEASKKKSEVETKTIAEVTAQMQQFKAEFENTQTEVLELRKSLADKEIELNDTLAAKNAALEKRDDEHLDEYNQVVQKYNDLFDENNQLRKEHDELVKDYNDLEEEKDKLEEEYDTKLASEKDELKKNYGGLLEIKDKQLKLSEGLLAKAKADLENVRSTLIEKETELEASEKLVVRKDKELEEQENALRILELSWSEHNRAEVESSARESKLKEKLKSADEAYLEHLQELLGQLESLYEQHSTAFQLLEDSLRRAQAQLESPFEGKVAVEIHRYATEVKRLNTEITNLKALVQDGIEKLDAKTRELESVAEALRALEDMKVQYSHAVNKIVRLKEELAAAKAAVPTVVVNETVTAPTKPSAPAPEPEVIENITPEVAAGGPIFQPTPVVEAAPPAADRDANQLPEQMARLNDRHNIIFGIALFIVLLLGFLSAARSPLPSGDVLQTCTRDDFFTTPPNSSSSWDFENSTHPPYRDPSTDHVVIKCQPSQMAKKPVMVYFIRVFVSQEILLTTNRQITSLTLHANQLWKSLKGIYALTHQHWGNWVKSGHYRRNKFWQLARLPYRFSVCTYKFVVDDLEVSFNECLFPS